MGQDESSAFYTEDMDEALERYLEAKNEHEEKVGQGRDLDSSDRKNWQAEVDRLSRRRRDCHNAAARLALTYGFADRRKDMRPEDELALARDTVKSMLRAYLLARG